MNIPGNLTLFVMYLPSLRVTGDVRTYFVVYIPSLQVTADAHTYLFRKTPINQSFVIYIPSLRVLEMCIPSL